MLKRLSMAISDKAKRVSTAIWNVISRARLWLAGVLSPQTGAAAGFGTFMQGIGATVLAAVAILGVTESKTIVENINKLYKSTSEVRDTVEAVKGQQQSLAASAGKVEVSVQKLASVVQRVDGAASRTELLVNQVQKSLQQLCELMLKNAAATAPPSVKSVKGIWQFLGSKGYLADAYGYSDYSSVIDPIDLNFEALVKSKDIDKSELDAKQRASSINSIGKIVEATKGNPCSTLGK